MTNMSRDLEGHQQGTQNVSIPDGAQKIASPPKRRVRSAAKFTTRVCSGLLMSGASIKSKRPWFIEED